jgi:hypothetical protein
LSADPWTIVARVDSGHEIDPNEVSRVLRLYLEPGECYTVQGLPSARSRLIRADDLTAAVAAVQGLADDRGVYVTLNPVSPTIGDHAPKNQDVVRRARLLVDIDAKRAEPDSMANEAEKAAALAVAYAIVAYLESLGWPSPVVVDSGNGVHLVYAVDLPNDTLARQYLSRVLKALAAAHNAEGAVVDAKVFDAKRITKLAGTWVRKGSNTPDRPHRMARILYAPAALEVVPCDRLKELADLADEGKPDTPPPSPMVPRDPWVMLANTAAAGDLTRYVRKAVDAELSRLATSAPPAHGGEGRNNALNAAAFALATLADWPEFNAADVLSQLRLVAERVGLDAREIDRTIESGWTSGKANPRQRPQPQAKAQDAGKSQASAEQAETLADDDLIIWGNDIVPRTVDWLWPNRVPRHFITIFAGRTGVGKSFVTCDLVARLTVGGEFPDSPGQHIRPGRALIISEDPYDTMLAPRLIALGANMEHVAFMTWKAMASYTLADIAMLERVWLQAKQPELLMIDPPTNFLAGVDEHKNVEVRRVLMNLVAWLQERPVAAVLITHLNKQVGKGIDAMSRIIGSVAWGTTSRIAHTFSPHPDRGDECIFACPKSNLGPLPTGLGYRIVPTESFATLEWTGEVDITADEAMSGTGKQTRGKSAVEFLTEMFADRREWPSDELKKMAREHGVSADALFKSPEVKALPLRKRPITTADGERFWVWQATDPEWPVAQVQNGAAKVAKVAKVGTEDDD